MDRGIKKVNDLEELSKVKDSEFVEINVDEKVREMVYHPTHFEEGIRIFFSRTGNSNYTAQFIIGKDHIGFMEGKLVFDESYKKELCNVRDGAFDMMDRALSYVGL